MIKENIYLSNYLYPMMSTLVLCDNCKHIINAGPNYKPKYCDMCGSLIKDNLDKIDWKYEKVSCVEYAQFMLEEYPDYIIRKVKFESTNWGKVGLPKSIKHTPVFIGKDMDDILDWVNHEYNRYMFDDFEEATKNELIEYAKTCSNFWYIEH